MKEVRPGRRLHIDVINDESPYPTLFLFHGAGGRGQQWRDQISMLKNHYRLIVPDWLGHGHSEKPKTASSYAFHEMLEDAHAVFEQFASTHNIVMGHSYGGALATCLAECHPDRIEKLILLAPLNVEPVPMVPPIYAIPVFMLEWMRPTLEKRFTELAFDPSASSLLIHEEKIASRNNPMYVIKPLFSGIKKLPLLDPAHIPTKTLIIIGETDQITLPKKINDFYSKLPNSKIINLSLTGHMLMLENSVEVNQLILDFLKD